MKLALISCVWGRLPVTRVWWKGVTRINQQFSDAGFETQIFVAGSEPEHRALCQQHSGTWVEYWNDYLGAKWNQVARSALDWGADYIFILGSDDFFGPGLIEQHIKYAKLGYKHIGLRGIYMYEPATDRTLRLVVDANGYYPTAAGASRLQLVTRSRPAIGAGRLLRSTCFGTQEFFWEPEKNRALDASMTKTLKLPAAAMIEPTAECLAVDVKTAENIWTFDSLNNVFAESQCLQPDSSALHSLPEWEDIRSLA